MQYDDEKDYVLRIIKEATSVLFTMLTGKNTYSLILQAKLDTKFPAISQMILGIWQT